MTAAAAVGSEVTTLVLGCCFGTEEALGWVDGRQATGCGAAPPVFSDGGKGGRPCGAERDLVNAEGGGDVEAALEGLGPWVSGVPDVVEVDVAAHLLDALGRWRGAD